MIYLEDALEKFNNLAPEVVLTIDSDAVAEKITTVENKYQISLSSLIIYWAIGEVKIDQIKDYLNKELGLDDKLSTEVESEIIEKIIKPITDRLIFLDATPAKTNMTMAQEKLIILEILKSRLKEELNSHPIIINAINSRIFTVLSVDHDFFGDMEKALYENQEKITANPIKVAGKLVEPTVANWLNDFITNYGTDYFTAVNLSQYITDSDNTKKISNPEKEIVTKVLLIYRNLKFFPETFDQVSETKWEILPLRISATTGDSGLDSKTSADIDESGMTALEIKAWQENQES